MAARIWWKRLRGIATSASWKVIVRALRIRREPILISRVCRLPLVSMIAFVDTSTSRVPRISAQRPPTLASQQGGANRRETQEPSVMSSQTPSITVRQILSEIWIPVLVTVMTVIAHDAVTGQSSGGAVIGAMIGVSIVMIRQSSAHPDISPTRRRLRLAAVTFAGTAAALMALHLYRYATGG